MHIHTVLVVTALLALVGAQRVFEWPTCDRMKLYRMFLQGYYAPYNTSGSSVFQSNFTLLENCTTTGAPAPPDPSAQVGSTLCLIPASTVDVNPYAAVYVLIVLPQSERYYTGYLRVLYEFDFINVRDQHNEYGFGLQHTIVVGDNSSTALLSGASFSFSSGAVRENYMLRGFDVTTPQYVVSHFSVDNLCDNNETHSSTTDPACAFYTSLKQNSLLPLRSGTFKATARFFLNAGVVSTTSFQVAQNGKVVYEKGSLDGRLSVHRIVGNVLRVAFVSQRTPIRFWAVRITAMAGACPTTSAVTAVTLTRTSNTVVETSQRRTSSSTAVPRVSTITVAASTSSAPTTTIAAQLTSTTTTNTSNMSTARAATTTSSLGFANTTVATSVAAPVSVPVTDNTLLFLAFGAALLFVLCLTCLCSALRRRIGQSQSWSRFYFAIPRLVRVTLCCACRCAEDYYDNDSEGSDEFALHRIDDGPPPPVPMTVRNSASQEYGFITLPKDNSYSALPPEAANGQYVVAPEPAAYPTAVGMELVSDDDDDSDMTGYASTPPTANTSRVRAPVQYDRVILSQTQRAQYDLLVPKSDSPATYDDVHSRLD